MNCELVVVMAVTLPTPLQKHIHTHTHTCKVLAKGHQVALRIGQVTHVGVKGTTQDMNLHCL